MALGISRDQAIKQLRQKNDDATVRSIVAYEIRALVRGNQLPSNFGDFDPRLLFELEEIPVADRTDDQKMELQALELNLTLWSEDKTTYDAFISLYERDLGKEREWLTYLANNEGKRVGVLGAICYLKGIFNLCIWPMDAQTCTMQSRPSFYFGDPAHNTCRHLLFTGNHYHKLEVISPTEALTIESTSTSFTAPPAPSRTPSPESPDDLLASLGPPRLT
jgi:hypothetical protein